MPIAPNHQPNGLRFWGRGAQTTVLLIALTAILTTGCVRRRLLVRSNPAGTMVSVDNQSVGVTPCAVDYTYYGTREVRLTMPGFETLTVNQPLPTPWYQLPGIDFFSENLLPTRIKDVRTVSYNLQRQRMAPAEEIIGRGEALRRQATPVGAAPLSATATPSPALAPPTFAPPTLEAPADEFRY